MHPMTALDFVALGLASALLAADREHRAAQALILLALLIAGSTLVGYVYGVCSFESLAAFNQMALHTTVGMLLISFGLLTSRPHRGIMASLSDEGPSGLMASRLLPLAILTPILNQRPDAPDSRAGWLRRPLCLGGPNDAGHRHLRRLHLAERPRVVPDGPGSPRGRGRV